MINDIGFLQMKDVIFHSTVLKWWWRWDLSRMAVKMVMMMWSYCRQLPQVVILYFLRWHLIWWLIWDWLAMKTMMILLQTELARFPTWLHKVSRTPMAAAFDELEVGRRLHIIVTSTTVIFIITTPITSINIVVQQPYHKVLGRHMEAGHLFLARQVDLHSSLYSEVNICLR